MDFTILDVSDYDPPRVLSKTWRELISDSHYNEDNLFVRYIQLEKGLTLFRVTGYNCLKLESMTSSGKERMIAKG